uniref:N-acetyltransferase domain-containing protein n=1 Tax=Chelydra serpentina TaxID=8475 RepID=A0A8C3SVF3_CHESE
GAPCPQYRDSDCEELVCGQHVPKNYLRMLTLPRTHLFLLGVSLVLLAAPILLAAGWLLMDSHYVRYVEWCLREDLGDIQKTYMEREDSHFWVAESEGDVVASVSAKPRSRCIDGEHTRELERLSARRHHQNGGIARALCRTVLCFAQQRGYQAGILDVSVGNLEGQRLYQSLGFRESYRFSSKK